MLISHLCSFKTGLVEIDAFHKSLLSPGSCSLASGVVCRSAGFSGGRTSQTPLVESSGPATHQEGSQISGDAATSFVDVVKQLARKAGFSKGGCRGCHFRPEKSHSMCLPGRVTGVIVEVFLYLQRELKL